MGTAKCGLCLQVDSVNRFNITLIGLIGELVVFADRFCNSGLCSQVDVNTGLTVYICFLLPPPP